MEFEVNRAKNINEEKVNEADRKIAYKFAAEAHREFGDMLRAVVLFGKTARKTETPKSDIDILVILDDISIQLTKAIIQTYRIITEKLVRKISDRIHVTTLKFTTFWEYMRAGDPVGMNILRDGLPIIDTGIFAPMQALLFQGRIRPTPESIWTYFARAPTTLRNSKWHLNQATIDLYWAVIDASHAALMKLGEIPPSPEHVPDLLKEKMVKTNLLERKYVGIVGKLYDLQKKIIHGELRQVSGKQYDALLKEAEAFVARMKKFIK
ncbi:hypothetical protein D6745_04645 [Candidatus Woesearchaeota archaeon]|nr:MAG: hypothetical protein D6745_04645 [Candidatus Woesearchaeota archaeon]